LNVRKHQSGLLRARFGDRFVLEAAVPTTLWPNSATRLSRSSAIMVSSSMMSTRDASCLSIRVLSFHDGLLDLCGRLIKDFAGFAQRKSFYGVNRNAARSTPSASADALRSQVFHIHRNVSIELAGGARPDDVKQPIKRNGEADRGSSDFPASSAVNAART